MRAAVAIVVGGLLALGAGCSSVPEVEYLDVDGASSGASSSGTSNGGPAEEYNCSDKPPPQERGICCGSRLCLGCTTANHCDKCERQNCGDNQVCCSGNRGVNVECLAQSACN